MVKIGRRRYDDRTGQPVNWLKTACTAAWAGGAAAAAALLGLRAMA